MYGWGTRITRHRFAECLARWAELPFVILVPLAINAEAPRGASEHVWLGD